MGQGLNPGAPSGQHVPLAGARFSGGRTHDNLGDRTSMAKKKGQVSRQTLWQRKHREMGLCVVCSEPAYKGWRCVKHYEQHKITMRLRYIPKVRGRYDVGGSAEFLAAAGRDEERKKKKRAAAKAKKKVAAKKQTPAEAAPAARDRPKRRAKAAAAGQGSSGESGD